VIFLLRAASTRRFAARRATGRCGPGVDQHLSLQPVLAQKSNGPWDQFADEASGRRFLIIRPKR
jgi:hypothetical protein